MAYPPQPPPGGYPQGGPPLNPYAAPTAHPPQGQPPQLPHWPPPRPSSPRVFGVLSIVFGSLTALFGGLIGAVGFYATQIERSSNKPEDIPLVLIFVTLAISAVLLVVIGIGQLRYRRWALGATLGWAVAALLLGVGQIAGFLAWVPDGEARLGFTFTWAIFLLPYPVLLLVFFTRPAIKAAMRD